MTYLSIHPSIHIAYGLYTFFSLLLTPCVIAVTVCYNGVRRGTVVQSLSVSQSSHMVPLTGRSCCYFRMHTDV